MSDETKRKRGRPPKPEAERGETVSFYASPDCAKRLDSICKSTGETRGQVICRAIKLLRPPRKKSQP